MQKIYRIFCQISQKEGLDPPVRFNEAVLKRSQRLSSAVTPAQELDSHEH